MSTCFPTCQTCGGSGIVHASTPENGWCSWCLPGRDKTKCACPDCVQGVVISDELRTAVFNAVAAAEDFAPGFTGLHQRTGNAVLAAVVTHLKEQQT